MTQNQERTILLVSDDAALCAAVRLQLEAEEKGLRVAAVSTVEAAHGIIADAAPAVILLEDTSVAADSREYAGHGPRLESAVSALAAYAPVVVIGQARHQNDLALLVAAGLADFVARSNGYLPQAIGLVQQRLQQAPKLLSIALPPSSLEDAASDAFGEVLRHELNNPLTGILGNAELLLAEVRRKNDGQLPNGGQQRLETIAALAVRLRETVHRLSQDWESRNRLPQRSVQSPVAH
jgi:signal transduction histidine kinase